MVKTIVAKLAWFLVDEYSGLTGRKGTTVVSVTSVLWFWVASHTGMVQWEIMRGMSFAQKCCLLTFLVKRLTCVSFSSVDFVVNVHGKFFKLMVTQLKTTIKRFSFSTLNNGEETK